ncbi:MAG: thioredoxin [Thermoplasmata archaeon]|nr:thioredoxin [Thermoplasmata archaeon]
MTRPMQLTDSSFKDTMTAHPLLVVDCWAPWCGPCKMLGPTIDRLAEEYADRITFGKLNVDDNREVSMTYGIQSIPTILIFKDGKLVDRIVGALPKPMLEAKFKPFL